MQNKNRVELAGVVGHIKEKDGITHFSVVTNIVATTDIGVVETTWHDCVYVGARMDGVKPGTPLAVEGRLRQTLYACYDGMERPHTEIYVTNYKILQP